MKALRNNWTQPLGLPNGVGTIEPGATKPIPNDQVLENTTVINWLRAGRLQLLGGKDVPEQMSQEPQEPQGNKEPESNPLKSKEPSHEHLKILDQSMPAIAEQLKGLSDDQFADVIDAEKQGKSRAGLLNEGGIFAQEWERRYGSNS